MKVMLNRHLDGISEDMTRDFYFKTPESSVSTTPKDSDDESDDELLLERPTASTARQVYAYGINAVPLPRTPKTSKNTKKNK